MVVRYEGCFVVTYAERPGGEESHVSQNIMTFRFPLRSYEQTRSMTELHNKADEDQKSLSHC